MQMRTEGFVFNLLLGLLNWTFFSSSAMMSTGIGRRSRGAGQERGVSARDSSGGNGPLQPRAIPARDCRVPSVVAADFWDRADARHPAVSAAPRAADSLHVRRGVRAGDVDVVLSRHQPHSGNRARHPFLDDADPLSVRQPARVPSAADSAQPDVVVRHCVSGDLSSRTRRRISPSGLPRAATPWACSFSVRRCSSTPKIGWRSRSDVYRDRLSGPVEAIPAAAQPFRIDQGALPRTDPSIAPRADRGFLGSPGRIPVCQLGRGRRRHRTQRIREEHVSASGCGHSSADRGTSGGAARRRASGR